jgi:HlyD family secretion protein
MATRFPRLATFAGVSLLVLGTGVACGPVAVPLIGSSSDTAGVGAQPQTSTIAVGAQANTTPTPAAPRPGAPLQVPVKRDSITETLSLDGQVAAAEQQPVTYAYKAIVDQVKVKAGQQVKQGDALIDFSTGDLPKNIDDARTRVQNSQVTLAQAQARQQAAAQKAISDQAQKDQAVRDAQAGVQAAQDNLSQVQKGKPQADRDAQQTAVSYGQAQLAEAQATLDRLMAGPDQAAISAAQAEVAKDQAAVAKAQADLATLTAGPDSTGVRNAESTLQRAQLQLKIVQASKPDPKADPAVAGLQHDAAVQDAQGAVQAADAALAKLKQPPAAADVQAARQKVDDATNTLNGAQAKLDTLQAGPDPAAVDAAKTNIEHIRHYIGEATANLNEVLSHPTPAELAAAQDQIRKAQTALDNAHRAAESTDTGSDSDFGALQDAVTQNQADLARLTQQLQDTHLTAPFDGTVVSVRIKAGETVTPGNAVVTLAKPSAPLVRVDLDDSTASKVSVGQDAIVQPDTGVTNPASIPAKVASATPATSNGSQGPSATLTVSWADGQTPKYGMPVQVSINVDTKTDVLVIPKSALHQSGGRSTVEIQDGTLRRVVTVQVGIVSDNTVEIVSGLNEGQVVLAAPKR